ncbi:MAG TPA: patatin-like phospholipase family protein [Pyrinomonadaceae bacterium]|nr:patatin-like phospholipase family protein [Pyrinomonadaceae bacterium]
MTVSLSADSSGTRDLLHGVNPDAAIASLKERSERWRAGNREPDGRKLGLVIEGGAMRAVCSAGGAVALAHLGFTDLFDEVYATSAGAMNASYFLSNQPLLGISVYFDSCTTRSFLNPLRVWKVIDVDYLFEQVVSVDKPLDVEKILSSRTRLFVAVIDKRTGAGTVIDTKATNAPLLSVLKAATALPVLYNRAIDIDGTPFMDGGLAIPFPIEQALANGCTDVLTLLTRPAGHLEDAAGWASRRMFDLICARGNVGLNQVYALGHEQSRRARDLALGRVATPPGVNIATVCTDEPEIIQRTTVNRALLHSAAVSYGRKTLRVFGADAEPWNIPLSLDALRRA